MFSHARGAAALALAGALAVTPLGAAAQTVGVTLNGHPVPLNPEPLVRAGRVFVPLRGIFERLGATVVYQSGTINATAGSRTISLQVGSTAAVVSGQQQTLDVAPFIVGASTYVPLRFVSQALGATVDYDATNRIVAILSGPVAAAPPPARSGVRLRERVPPDDSFVAAVQPLISGTFSAPVDPNRVRVFLDGLDVTESATRSPTGFVYAPPSPLQTMRHTVRVTGIDANGVRFERTWSFTSGTKRPAIVLDLSRPHDGEAVGPTFVVAGRTLPNARVHLVAGAVATVGGVFAFGSGTYVGDTIADGDGNFSQTVQLQTVSGAEIGLTVTATDPESRDTTARRLRLSAR